MNGGLIPICGIITIWPMKGIDIFWFGLWAMYIIFGGIPCIGGGIWKGIECVMFGEAVLTGCGVFAVGSGLAMLCVSTLGCLVSVGAES
jgi:hypothetical protein